MVGALYAPEYEMIASTLAALLAILAAVAYAKLGQTEPEITQVIIIVCLIPLVIIALYWSTEK